MIFIDKNDEYKQRYSLFLSFTFYTPFTYKYLTDIKYKNYTQISFLTEQNKNKLRLRTKRAALLTTYTKISGKTTDYSPLG